MLQSRPRGIDHPGISRTALTTSEWRYGQQPAPCSSVSCGRSCGQKYLQTISSEGCWVTRFLICPLFGTVSRLAEQRGIRVLVEALADMLCENEMQFVGLELQVIGNAYGYAEFTAEEPVPESSSIRGGLQQCVGSSDRGGCGLVCILYRPGLSLAGLNRMYSLRYGNDSHRQWGGRIG